MSMHKPNTIYELIDWCFRKLGGDNLFGAPVGGVIDVDVTKQQAIDRVYEAITLFNQCHYYGYRETGVVLQCIAGQQIYTMPSEIQEVITYLPLDDKSSIFSLDYQMMQSIGTRQSQFDLVTIELTYEYIKLMKMMIGRKVNFTFNGLTHQLVLSHVPQADEKLVLICYMTIDVEQYGDVFSDIWLKDYTFNLMKLQWAENLGKFGNVNLPGGITINAEKIYQEAEARLATLREELNTTYSFPPQFQVG